jgi:phage gp29-like protein
MIIDKKALFSDIATRARSPAGLGRWLALLPNPDPILRARGQAIGVYRQLRAEPLVGSSIRRRKSAVKCLERGLEAGQAPAHVVRFIEQTLAQWDMNRIIGELLDAAFFGYQPAELTWFKDGRHLVVTDVVGKPPEWFTFDTDNRLRFQAQQSGLAGEVLPPRKFVVATQDATFDNPYGFADLSLCFWPVTFKKAGWSFWMRFSEKYGTPWVVGRHPRGQDQAHIAPLLHSLEQMVQDAVAVIPDDSSIEFKEPATKGASSRLYKDLIEMARSEITIALLGQNQTTEAETNHASAQAGLEVAADIRDGDAVMVMSAVNQIVRWLVELNFGAVPAPVWRLWEQETIDEVQAKRDLSLAQTAGFFSAQYYQREYGLQPGDLLMESAPHATSSAAPPLTFSEDETKTVSEPQAQLDRALDSLMKNGTLDNTLQPLLTPLFKTVQSGVAPGELRGKLAAFYPGMQADALQETLARVMFVANVWGRLHA